MQAANYLQHSSRKSDYTDGGHAKNGVCGKVWVRRLSSDNTAAAAAARECARQKRLKIFGNVFNILDYTRLTPSSIIYPSYYNNRRVRFYFDVPKRYVFVISTTPRTDFQLGIISVDDNAIIFVKDCAFGIREVRNLEKS